MARVSLTNVHIQYDRLMAETTSDMDSYVSRIITAEMQPPHDPHVGSMSQRSLRDQYVHATHMALSERGLNLSGSGLADAVYTLIGMALTENMQLKDQIRALMKERERAA